MSNDKPSLQDDLLLLVMSHTAYVVILWVLWITIPCIIIFLVVRAAKAAAPEHQTMKPGLCWLLLIPIFNIYWNFKALPAVSNSLKATLEDKGQACEEIGNVGRFEGLCLAWIVAAGPVLFLLDWILFKFAIHTVSFGIP